MARAVHLFRNDPRARSRDLYLFLVDLMKVCSPIFVLFFYYYYYFFFFFFFFFFFCCSRSKSIIEVGFFFLFFFLSFFSDMKARHQIY